MSKLMTIQDRDREKIEILMKDLKVKKQIDVFRMAIDLLGEKVSEEKRKKRLLEVVKKVAKNSMEVNKEFQKYARFKRHDY